MPKSSCIPGFAINNARKISATSFYKINSSITNGYTTIKIHLPTNKYASKFDS